MSIDSTSSEPTRQTSNTSPLPSQATSNTASIGSTTSSKSKESALYAAMNTLCNLMAEINTSLMTVSTYILNPDLANSDVWANMLGTIQFPAGANAASSAYMNEQSKSTWIQAKMKAQQSVEQQDVQLASSMSQNITQITSLIQNCLQSVQTCISAISNM